MAPFGVARNVNFRGQTPTDSLAFASSRWLGGRPDRSCIINDAVDEGSYVVSAVLEFQLGADRILANVGDFAWVPRDTPHTFACASEEQVHVIGFAIPGGIEHLFEEQFSYLSMLTGPPDPAVLDEMGLRHRAPSLGPPITASNAPAS